MRRAGVALGLVLAAAALARVGYVLWMDVPIFDPFRHLLLVRNLRAGAGFTLFEGQPYLWYPPVWYRLAALFPAPAGLEVLATCLSWLAVPLLAALPASRDGHDVRRATAAALLMGLTGPTIAFTCHWGSEALALALCLGAAILFARRDGAPAGLVAGALFGLALVVRLNFALAGFLFVPWLRRPARVAAFAAGAAPPLVLAWWRNHVIVSEHPWVFTWDGLATPSDGFGLVSTLLVQSHPSVSAALRALHEQIVPLPEWLAGPDGFRPASTLFVVAGLAAAIASRRLHLALGAVLGAAYLLFGDRTMSANFFRIWLPLFPYFFLGAGEVLHRLRSRGTRGAVAGWGLVATLVAAGAPAFVPQRMWPLDLLAPPPELLERDAYMVNSGFYHPESVMLRYPERRFIGMPLEPERLDDLRRHFPGYDAVLWQEFSVQDDLRLLLEHSPDWRVTGSATNPHGRRYVVLEHEP